MRNALLSVVSAAAVLAALPAQTYAHHSFSAEFDIQKPVSLEGEVVKMEWVNPHSWLHIAVKKSDGTVEQWAVEGGAPAVLLRRGWTRDSLPAGMKVKVEGYQAKDGSLRANARALQFPDGRELELGGTALPD